MYVKQSFALGGVNALKVVLNASKPNFPTIFLESDEDKSHLWCIEAPVGQKFARLKGFHVLSNSLATPNRQNNEKTRWVSEK